MSSRVDAGTGLASPADPRGDAKAAVGKELRWGTHSPHRSHLAVAPSSAPRKLPESRYPPAGARTTVPAQAKSSRPMNY